MAIAVLERELGVSLFHRVGREAVPTDAGNSDFSRPRPVLPIRCWVPVPVPDAPDNGRSPMSSDRVIVQIS